jgi:hypothetical protein
MQVVIERSMSLRETINSNLDKVRILADAFNRLSCILPGGRQQQQCSKTLALCPVQA